MRIKKGLIKWCCQFSCRFLVEFNGPPRFITFINVWENMICLSRLVCMFPLIKAFRGLRFHNDILF